MQIKFILRSFLIGASTCLTYLILLSAAHATDPVVTMINPSEGTVGTVLIISGSDFGTKRGLVFIGNRPCKTLSWDDTSIMAQVLRPMPPGEYSVVVRFPGGP